MPALRKYEEGQRRFWRRSKLNAHFAKQRAYQKIADELVQPIREQDEGRPTHLVVGSGGQAGRGVGARAVTRAPIRRILQLIKTQGKATIGIENEAFTSQLHYRADEPCHAQ